MPLKPPIECLPVTAVSVMDEIMRRLSVPGTGFYDLPRSPIGWWITRDLDRKHLAAGMIAHKKDIEGPGKDRPDAEEITGPDISDVPLEEFPLTWRRSPVIGSAHVLGGGPGRDSKFQPGEFGLQSPLALQGVLRGHAPDKRSEFERDPATSGLSSALRAPVPIETPTLAVPTEHSLGVHDQKRFSPVGEPPACKDLESPISVR